jgi:hypothetical protein
MGNLKGFITIDPGVTVDLEKTEITDEELLMTRDAEEMANLKDEKPEEFDKVEETPAEEGAEADTQVVKKLVTKRLPRVAKPIGDVMREIMIKDIGEENVITKQSYNQDEILQIVKKLC